MAPLQAIENLKTQDDVGKADRDQTIQRLVGRIKELELELYGLTDSQDDATGREPRPPADDGRIPR